MNNIHKKNIPYGVILIVLIMINTSSLPVRAWTSTDASLQVNGYFDQTTHQRFGNRSGLSKSRSRGQLEFSKYFKPRGIFSEISLHGTLRATYDSAYDLNENDWGDSAGGPVTLENAGGPLAASSSPLSLLGAIPVSDRVPWGGGFGGAASPVPPGFFDFGLAGINNGNLGFDISVNPNEGLRILNSESFLDTGGMPGFGGVQFAYPVRPCDVDPRGCIDGYLDYDESELKSPEFNDRQDWLRELYLDATIPLDSGAEINFRIGRQQVVWGRTDLFRVLDQVNPIDFSIQNIYEEFEDSRIPLGIFSTEYRAGPKGIFDDLNFQFLWTFEKFRPHNLGQGGSPYSILDAGNLFRALNTCWEFGCTVANFAPNNSPLPPIANPAAFGGLPLPPGFSFAPNNGLIATDFAPGTLGIREAFIPTKRDQFGFRIEGVFKSVGFSVNALSYYSQLPSLHGGSSGPAAVNPFITPGVANPLAPPGLGEVGGTAIPRPYLIAFDIHFPKIFLVGASTDFYIDKIKSSFRFELAHTNGEEFPNTLDPRLYSRSKVVRWVAGWDRQTFIRALNPNRSFLFSAQVFGEHLLDHQLIETPFGEAGMPHWKDNYFITFLVQGFYKNDRLQPRILSAYDVNAQSFVLGPQIDWIINDNWRLIAGANFKFGRTKNQFDDVRLANQFPPFTDPSFGFNPALAAVGQSVVRAGGNAPLGIFRGGPIGQAQDEDELQLVLRYQF